MCNRDGCWRATSGRGYRCITLGFSLNNLVTTFAVIGLWQVVFQDDEYFPLVAVRIANPSLVLNRIAATRLHLVASQEPGLGPLFTNRQHILRRGDLNAQVRQRAALAEGMLVQRQVQRRVLDVELGISRPNLAWFKAE